MTWDGIGISWWIICPAGPFAIPSAVAAERIDAARPVILGTYEDAVAARERMGAETVVDDLTGPAVSPVPDPLVDGTVAA